MNFVDFYSMIFLTQNSLIPLKRILLTGINQFLEIILSHNFMPQMTLPTRVIGRTATLIENILINRYENKCTFGSITTSVFRIKNPKATIRGYKNFDNKSFQSDIKKMDWSLATENDYVNLGFKTLVQKL